MVEQGADLTDDQSKTVMITSPRTIRPRAPLLLPVLLLLDLLLLRLLAHPLPPPRPA